MIFAQSQLNMKSVMQIMLLQFHIYISQADNKTGFMWNLKQLNPLQLKLTANSYNLESNCCFVCACMCFN